jgi:hypothetical protein
MSALRTRRGRPPKPQIASSQPFMISQHNQAYEDAKRGIVPSQIQHAYRRLAPKKQGEKKLKPFTMTDISKVRVFTRDEAKKLFKVSLFSRAEEYDTLRSSYLKL